MAKMLTVKAGKNGPVPLGTPIQGKSWITDPVEVESTRFIRRRIEAGDLIIVGDDDYDEDDDETMTGESVEPIAVVHTSAPARFAPAPAPAPARVKRSTIPPEGKGE